MKGSTKDTMDTKAEAAFHRVLCVHCVFRLLKCHFFTVLTCSLLPLGGFSTAVDAQPADLIAHMRAASQATRERRFIDAITELREVTERAPALPAGWYALGQAYNDLSNEALATFDQAFGQAEARPFDSAERAAKESDWRQLLAAEALLAHGRLIDAFTLYRQALERLPSMVSIHDSIARIYDQTGHADWAERERAAGARSSVDCAARKALCEFRGGRYAAALAAALTEADAESRYWRARAAAELSLAAFKRLDGLPDSAERRSVRAGWARAEERNLDAIAELNAALTFAPDNPALIYDLASSYYAARDYEQVVATLTPLLLVYPDDVRLLKLVGYAYLQLRRLEEALPLLRRAADRDASDPGPQRALGRAYLQTGEFARAIPLIEAQLASDEDGSLHVQLARAYTGIGRKDKTAALLERSQQLQRAADERAAAAARRKITPPL
jgi:predicted Zn-dependent protease